MAIYSCRGVIFHTLETVRYYMAKAKTKKGLKVKVSVLDKVYETGRKYAAGFKKTMKIVCDEFLPKWNYRAVPPVSVKSGSCFRPVPYGFAAAGCPWQPKETGSVRFGIPGRDLH